MDDKAANPEGIKCSGDDENCQKAADYFDVSQLKVLTLQESEHLYKVGTDV